MINIVLLIYKRIHTLRDQLIHIHEQSCIEDIHLHIICNNPELKLNFKEIIDEYKSKIKITFIEKQNKLMFLERHYYAYKNKFDYVIFLDDDLYLKKEHIENLYNMRREKTFFTFYGRVFKDRKNIKLLYSNNKPSTHIKSIAKNSEFFNYGGPGFSILDCSIYDDFFKIYTSFNKEMQEYSMKMDDIFLSWAINNTEKWNIKNSFLRPEDCKNMDAHSSYQDLWKYKDTFAYKLNSINSWKKI